MSKLANIQDLCESVVAAYKDPMYYDGADCSDLANQILGIIKGIDA